MGDGEALARIHADMAVHYAELDPERFRRPDLTGYAEVLEADLGDGLDLVAEVDGEVIAWLYARLIEPPEHARFAYPRDVEARRLSIDYLATLKEHRRSGAGTALVQAARGLGPRARRDRRRDDDLPPRRHVDGVLDRARRLRGALDQPAQAAHTW